MQDNEIKYRALFEQAPEAIVLIDPENGELVEFNTKAHKQLGYTRDEFKKLKIPDFEVLQSPDDVKKHFNRLLRDGFITFETKHKTKDGEIKDIYVSGKSVYILGKKFIQSIWHDNTEKKKMEEKMQESEKKYRTLFEQAPDAIVLVDPENGALAEFNDKAPEQVGYTREEYKKLKIPDIDIFQSPEEVIKVFNKVLRDGFALFNTKHKTKTGEIKDIFVSIKPVDIRGKKFLQTVCRDITEQTKVTEKMQESEAKYRTLFEHAVDAIVLVDPESGEFVEFNTRAHEHLGYTRDEFKKLRIWDFEAIQSAKDVKAEFNRIIKDGFHTFETKQRTKTGEIKDILVSSKPVDIRGKKLIQGIWRDITEQKKMAEKLQESETKYRTLFEQAADTIILVDPESGEFVDFNTKAHEHLGYTRDEFKKLRIWDFEAIQSAKDVKTEFNRIIEDGFHAFETKQRTKTGEFKDILVSSKPVDIRGKKFIQTIWKDITEQKKMAEKVQESETKYRTLFEQAPDTIVLVDPESGEFVDFNARAHEHLRYTQEEFKELKIWDLEVIESTNDVKQRFNAILKIGFEVFETKHRTKNDEIRDILVASKVLEIRGKKLIQGIWRDITEQKKMEEKLKYFAILVENVSEAILSLDMDLKIVSWNKAAEKIYGWKAEEVIGKRIIDINSLEFQSKDLIKILNEFLEKGYWNGISIQNNKDGTSLTILLTATLIYDGIGNRIGIVIINRDITEAKKAEEKLLESYNRELFLGNIIRNATVGICVSYPDGNLSMFNSAYEALVGYDKEELKKINWITDLTPNKWKEHENNKLEELYKMKKSVIYEKEYIRKDGSKIPIELLVYPQFDENGSINSYVAFISDITERKKAEEIILQEKKFSENLINSSIDGIFAFDLNGCYTIWNPGMERITGIKKEICIGKKAINFFPFLKKSGEDKFLYDILAGKGPISRERPFRVLETGIEGYFEGYYSPLYDENKKIIGGIGIIHDITDRKKVEEKLKDSELKYRDAYERTEFYKDIFAHDISNILQNIKSAQELLLIWQNKPEKQDKIKTLGEIINDQVIRGSKLVSNIRKLSEISEAGFHTESIEALQLLNEAIKFVYKSYPEKNIDLKIESQFKIINVKANQLLLDVFENILFNGIKYNENKKIEIISKVSREIKNFIKYIKFEIIDNGIGIPDVIKKRIFEGISVRKEKSHGMGLGLLFVKNVLSSYNGEIWVEDKFRGNPSEGSNFVILIPEVV